MNTALFGSTKGPLAPPADTVNVAGGKAYAMGAEATLATLVATGTLNDQFYTEAKEQLESVLKIASGCSSEYIAKCSVFGRQRGFMKDMPALLLAILAGRKTDDARASLSLAFPRVIDNGKMLRNFVQMVRSGAAGRKSLGSQPRRLVAEWLLSRSPTEVYRQSVGDKPSMADVVRLARPKPGTAEQSALFAYLIGKEHIHENLPAIVRELEAWRAKPTAEIPRVPWEMLTSGEITPEHWKQIARNATWTQLRMNLNTFQRHGCWDDPKLVEYAAKRLADPHLVRSSRCFPYQLLAAFAHATDVPTALRLALQDAMEVACENVPAIEGVVHVYPDVSGSMSSAVTGARGTATSKVRCVDAAALVAAAITRKNPNAKVVPFDVSAYEANINPRDSIMTNAEKLARYGGGGTDCAQPLCHAIYRKEYPDIAIFLSDNASWVDGGGMRPGSATNMMAAWMQIRAKKPAAKLVCVDMAAYATVQAKGNGILNIGGFSDAVFETIAGFANGTLTDADWSGIVNAVRLDASEATLPSRPATNSPT